LVIGVGEGVKGFKLGDRVACAGVGKANHAEVVLVPENLAVKIPDECTLKDAASVTIGAIAMQGVRRADLRLGEIVAVVGLGLLGQVSVQLLKAAGCRVVAVDIDSNRVKTAGKLGADYSFINTGQALNSDIANITGGYGVDTTILTAASASNEIAQQAMEITRKKGRVVVVGAVGLGLKRSPFYEKEIDFLISCSYGPGRYDPEYEEKNVDYPYAYVRWTEKRNMEEYLRLVGERKINLKALLDREYAIGKAPAAYEELATAVEKPIGVLLAYGISDQSDDSKIFKKLVLGGSKVVEGKVNVAVLGAGSFAKSVHLPNLKKLGSIYKIRAIVSQTGNKAKDIAHKYEADYCSTDYNVVLNDDKVDAVLIATRHKLHARMAIEAVRVGKAVFLEKPLALNKEELEELVAVLSETNVQFTVGFNRRFSPLVQKIKTLIKDRANSMIINYRMNAGFIPKTHWVHSEEGGGRNIGEACHIYDLFNCLTDSEVNSISAAAISPRTDQYNRNDNFVATIAYSDGSVCNLVYTALGSKEVPKEQMEIYVDGQIISLNDYRELQVFGPRNFSVKSKAQNKGYYRELEEFGRKLRDGGEYLIPLEQLVQATEISFAVEKMIWTR
jgi:predicted dehydrogenase/threonine dehydrogenase-like Zn-dependent dehydrogenase